MAKCRFEPASFDSLTKATNGGHRMKYVLLIYLEENALSEPEREQCYAESAQLAQQLDSKGQYLTTAPLHPVATATSVRVRDGKPLVTDGPFAETREQLGGFFLINAQDLDEAIAIATQIPGAQVGTVEIRPVIEVAGLPD
ncbi:YciI family protein [Funiculus sociatus GB2-M2]